MKCVASKIIGFLSIFFPCAGNSEMYVVEQFDVIEQSISQNSGVGVLILIDIGGTLIKHSNPLAYRQHVPWVMDWFEQNVPTMNKDKILSLLYAIRNENEKWILTFPQWPQLIRCAREQGAKVVAFSRHVPDPEVRNNRLQRLENLGLSLSDDLNLELSDHYIYERGVIEVMMSSKASCLAEILKFIRPSQIIFIDNERRQFDKINEVCSKQNIPCKEFLFIDAEDPLALDPKLANEELLKLVFPDQFMCDGL